MSLRAVFVSLAVALVAAGGFVLFFSVGRGSTVYVPNDAVLARERGEHLINKRRHTTDPVKKAEYLTQAIDEFKKAVELKPDFEVAYNMLGHAYIERGDFETALKHLDRAIALRAEYPAALYNRALVYQKLSVSRRDHELLDRSIADYKIALNSELAAAFAGDIRKALADAYHQKGDLKAAIAELSTYLKLAPHAPDAGLVRRKIRGLQLMQGGPAPELDIPLE